MCCSPGAPLPILCSGPLGARNKRGPAFLMLLAGALLCGGVLDLAPSRRTSAQSLCFLRSILGGLLREGRVRLSQAPQGTPAPDVVPHLLTGVWKCLPSPQSGLSQTFRLSHCRGLAKPRALGSTACLSLSPLLCCNMPCWMQCDRI